MSWRVNVYSCVFEGVGACTEVYVNGKLVGTHKGGYSAFAFEIGTALKLGG